LNKELLKLAEQIKKRRLELNLTQEELAHRCNFDRTYISMLERGKRNPSYLNLMKLCNGLDILLADLL
jgi:putative transcriptional regulator